MNVVCRIAFLEGKIPILTDFFKTCSRKQLYDRLRWRANSRLETSQFEATEEGYECLEWLNPCYATIRNKDDHLQEVHSRSLKSYDTYGGQIHSIKCMLT